MNEQKESVTKYLVIIFVLYPIIFVGTVACFCVPDETVTV